MESDGKSLRVIRHGTQLGELSGRSVHAALAGADVAIRRLVMPLMPKLELLEAAKWELKDQVAFPIQEAALDVRVLGEVVEQDVKKQDVLAAAAPSRAVSALIGELTRARLRIESISPQSCAAWECVAALIPEARRGSVAVLDIGCSQTSIVIAHDGAPQLVREIAFGSDLLTQALVGTVALDDGGAVTIDRPMAERLKQRHGILSDAAEGKTDENIPLFHLASLMRPVMEQVLTELSRLFDFYKTQGHSAGVQRLLICGMDATLSNLQVSLSEGLGIPVEVFNPLQHLPQPSKTAADELPEAEGSRLAAAIGLALSHGQGVNLLPRASQTANAAGDATANRTPRLAAAVGLIALAVTGGFLAAVGISQWHVSRQQRLWQQIEPAYTQRLNQDEANRSLDAALDIVQTFFERQPLWGSLLKELAALVPATIELTECHIEFEGERRIARLKGRVIAAGNGGGVAQLAEALERSPFFSDVNLIDSEVRSSEMGASTFSLEAFLE